MSQDIEQSEIVSFAEIYLSADQVTFLRTMLPQYFSLQQSKKIPKRQKKESVSKIYDYQVNQKDIQSKPTSIREGSNKEIPEDVDGKMKRPRPKKVDRFLEEQNVRNKPKINYSTQRLSQQQTNKALALLNALKKNSNSWPFLEPVNPKTLGVPDYFDIIKQPMDLSTVEKNLKNFQYSTINQFHGDINKIWINSYRYNQKGSQVYKVTIQMEKAYKKILAKSSQQNVLAPKKFLIKQKLQKPVNFKVHKPKQQSNQMTFSQKKQLCSDIKRLPKQYLSGIWSIVANGKDSSNQLQFDIEQLDSDKVWKLYKYVNQTLDKVKSYQQKKNQDNKKQQRIHSQDVVSAESSFLLQSESQN